MGDDKILKEAHQFNASDFDMITGPIKNAMKAFGKTVSASAKLIGNDVASLLKHNLRLTLPSLKKQKDMMDNWRETRGKHMKTIYENQTAALEGLGPDKYTMMLMCPAKFWGAAAYRGTPSILSKETRAMIGEYGADKLPIIGGLFGSAGSRGYQRSLWDDFVNNDEAVGSKRGSEQMVQSWNSFVGRHEYLGSGLQVKPPSGGGGGEGVLADLFYKINSIFLLQLDHRVREAELIREGEEKEKEVKDNMEKAEEFMVKFIEDQFKTAYVSERQEYIKEHRKVYEPVVESVEAIFKLNIGLAKSDDPDEFFQIIDKAVGEEKDLKDIDAAKLKEEFDKMVGKLAEDEEVLKTLRKELEKSGDLKKLQEGDEEAPQGPGPSEKEKSLFEEKLKKIALDNCKGGFLQTLKEGMLDLYDNTVSRVADGLQEETMEDMANSGDEIAIEYVDQIKEFHERLENAMSNIK